MDLKKYVGCKKSDNTIFCYVTKYAPKTWSAWSIIVLILSVILKVNKKIIFFILCAVILNSIMGFILIQFLAKEKLMKTFNISYPLLTFYDIIIHIIPLFVIFKYYSPPKISNKEIIIGFITLSIAFLTYDKIMNIDKMYLSVSILKLHKTIHITFYLLCYLSIIYLYKNKITFL
tara:strand:- start:3567 stop:4091 length:525 start_codon:yes stop_codon:yes gene_type:complete